MAPKQNKLQLLPGEKRKFQNNLDSVDSKVFQIFFLKNDEDKSVKVVETSTIPLNELIQRLKNGESVFLIYKSTQSNRNLMPIPAEDLNEPWYFTHI